ncbi:hypothetical protein P152DRAFT_461595 [Eremomyces bilateralis CBS 781.70]|uniref:Transcription factor TFIIIC triple barrel domain-containing protein n=1 Tax=Eremomyces bilateralis CBS 781.70 TaxID=1392243 RepID=A0A6G1FUM1_9PEZI|nr:uncharacterized protein P152DRAFT_461595 [Eremomyces bilateralis CBS 781.70]KAF1809406.1 hypothetical protein P152DRAFT_461595 [Eremomyces bilateralis CBS 781.70]
MAAAVKHDLEVHSNGHDDENEGSDWEYEYDENDKETFHVSIDFSSATVPPPPPSGIAPGVVQNASLSQHKPKDDDLRSTPSSLRSSSSDGSSDESGVALSAGPETSQANESIQILALASSNPILYFRGSYFTTQWTRPIGGHLFFSKSSSATTELESTSIDLETESNGLPSPADKESRPLRSMQNYDLLGVGTARLRASNAKLKRKQPDYEPPPPPTELPREPSLPAIEGSAADGPPMAPAGRGKRIILETGASKERMAQARFLERLSELKAKKGEEDEVKVTKLTAIPPPGAEIPIAADTAESATVVGGTGEDAGVAANTDMDMHDVDDASGSPEGEDANHGTETEQPGKRRRRWKRRVDAMWVEPATLQDPLTVTDGNKKDEGPSSTRTGGADAPAESGAQQAEGSGEMEV